MVHEFALSHDNRGTAQLIGAALASDHTAVGISSSAGLPMAVANHPQPLTLLSPQIWNPKREIISMVLNGTAYQNLFPAWSRW